MKWMKLMLSCVLCMTMTACTKNNIKTNTDTSSVETDDSDYHTYVVDGKEYSYNSHLMNFLITGVDTRDAEGGQSDFILLLSFDRENDQYRILQLDRSAYVDIKLYDAEHNFLGWDKSYLALSYAYGTSTKQSTLYTKDAVSRLLNNIPITYYMTLSLDDLPKIQDVVGPIQVEVVDDLLVEVNPEWTKGSMATVDASNVEQFIRYRNTDISGSNEIRMERQKEYLNTYLSIMKDMINSDFDKTLDRVSDVAEEVYTNVELSEISDILDMITEYTFDDIYQLPGEVVQGKFRTQFNIDDDQLPYLIKDLYYK